MIIADDGTVFRLIDDSLLPVEGAGSIGSSAVIDGTIWLADRYGGEMYDMDQQVGASKVAELSGDFLGFTASGAIAGDDLLLAHYGAPRWAPALWEVDLSSSESSFDEVYLLDRTLVLTRREADTSVVMVWQ